MRSEPLNKCHSDGVTPIASSHSALIFSVCCWKTFTFTCTKVHFSPENSSFHIALIFSRTWCCSAVLQQKLWLSLLLCNPAQWSPVFLIAFIFGVCFSELLCCRKVHCRLYTPQSTYFPATITTMFTYHSIFERGTKQDLKVIWIKKVFRPIIIALWGSCNGEIRLGMFHFWEKSWSYTSNRLFGFFSSNFSNICFQYLYLFG